ncbi:MAG TPA: AMP-binding protein [Pyrinomonadaceae bacterium]|nr:AMP-binding protein [Pyrinomonadaceae bacterium]
MKSLLVEYLDDFIRRGDEIAFAHRRGLRTYRWTYKETAIAAHQFAHKLAALDIIQGDRVLLWADNSAEWVVAFFGCLLRGATVVPLDVLSAGSFVKRIQDQVGAKLAILDPTTSKQFDLDLSIFKLDEIKKPANTASESASTGARVPSIAEDDVIEIVFTSGTTAEPKGTRITNRNLMSNLMPLEQEIQLYLKYERWFHPIRFLNLLPLSHVFGQFMGVFIPQLLGGTVVFGDSLNPARIIETVKRERVSVLVCVPRILDSLREKIERDHETRGKLEEFRRKIEAAKDWHAARRWWAFRSVHWRFGLKFWAFIVGGATLNPETDQFWRRLGFAVIQGYGLTETAALVSVNHPFKRGRGSIGKVMPGQEVKLSADGEILVRGKNVSPGYWKDEAQGSTEDGGWFHTGDMGEFDSEGNLFFKGRKKDVIVTSAGMNVFPEDIELILNRQPEVRLSTVIGVEGPNGPEPLAVLILADREAEPRAVVERANKSLNQHQQVRRWFVWPDEDFPRTATQKVKKTLVRERVNIDSSPRAEFSSQSSPLGELIARVSRESKRELEPSALLATDLRLDSLGRVELLSAIEDRFQVEIDEAHFNEATTVADVERLISSGAPRPSRLRDTPSSVVPGPLKHKYPYPQWPHRWPLNWLRVGLLYAIIFPLTRVMGRASVKGIENLSNTTGPLLFISNHLSMVDHGLILWALPARFRTRMSIAMDGEILREWIDPPEGTGWFTRLRYRVQYALVVLFFNVFAMPRHSGFRRSFAFAGRMVDQGYSVLVFPEGRRSPDGTLQTFKPGIGILTKDLNIPVVPVRIDGLFEVAQQGKHFAPPGAIAVTISKPVVYSPSDSADEIAKDLEDRIRKLSASE